MSVIPLGDGGSWSGGTFTAPSAGVYIMSLEGSGSGGMAGYGQTQVKVNGSVVTPPASETSETSSAWSYAGVLRTEVQHLAAGDTLQLWSAYSGGGGTVSFALSMVEVADSLTSGGSSGMTNPMTAAQDLIVGGTAGAPGRLGVGTSGQVLAVGSGGAVEWASAASTSFSLASFSGDALATINQGYSLVLVIGALLVLGVGYTIASGLRK
jgi:hypothetical protein